MRYAERAVEDSTPLTCVLISAPIGGPKEYRSGKGSGNPHMQQATPRRAALLLCQTAEPVLDNSEARQRSSSPEFPMTESNHRRYSAEAHAHRRRWERYPSSRYLRRAFESKEANTFLSGSFEDADNSASSLSANSSGPRSNARERNQPPRYRQMERRPVEALQASKFP